VKNEKCNLLSICESSSVPAGLILPNHGRLVYNLFHKLELLIVGALRFAKGTTVAIERNHRAAHAKGTTVAIEKFSNV